MHDVDSRRGYLLDVHQRGDLTLEEIRELQGILQNDLRRNASNPLARVFIGFLIVVLMVLEEQAKS